MVGLQWDRVEIERAPTAWERQDFNQWYGLAVRFKLVTDYCWQGAEYWVLVNGVWKGFCEMLQVFLGAWLKKLEGGAFKALSD